MSLTDEERTIIVNLEIEKSLKFISEVPSLMNLKFWDTALNRLYYSIFHAASALLINDGNPVKTHKGISVVLGQQYVLKGILEPEDVKFYTRLQNLRERGDYNCAYNADEELITQLYPQASSFITKIKSILIEKEN